MGYPEMSGLELFQMPFCNHAARQVQTSGQPGPAKQLAAQPKATQAHSVSQAAAKWPETQDTAGQDTKPAAVTKNPDSRPSHLLAENECASTVSAPEGQAVAQDGKGQAAVSKKPAQGQKTQSVPGMAKPLENTQEQPEIQEKELVLDMSTAGPVADGNGKPCKEDDAARRKAHEAAEAKRKAEWEEAKQAKKQAEALALQKLQSMSDDEAVAASTRRISTDVERITRRNLKECVAEHIQELCRKDPAFARCTMNPKKSMINCFKYINRQAKEFVKQEMEDNSIKQDNDGYGCDVPDGIVYQWAEDYFNDPDAPEDQKKEEKFVPRPYEGAASKPKKAASRPKKAAKPAEKGSKKQKPDNSFEQMSLF